MLPMNAAIVGCGNISTRYFEAASRFSAFNIAACADLDRKRARAQAAAHAVPKEGALKQILNDRAIELVINLTTPQAHAEVSLAAIKAGKHVYSEKPLTQTRDEAKSLQAAAREAGLCIGCAPDTVLGAGIQTARKLIDDGWIGAPVAATAFMMCHGHEHWHPDPAFYYQPGGGPLFDMGPYYLSALITLIGPVLRVSAAARATFPERTISSDAKKGERIPVQVPTHVAGVLEFVSGPIVTLITSFDVWSHQLPFIEIYGETGSISVPDPNTFDGPVRVCRLREDQWREVPLTHPFREPSRGLGVADMVCALRTGRPHRANAEVAFHVLDIMHALHESAGSGQRVDLKSTCERPEAMAMHASEAEIP